MSEQPFKPTGRGRGIERIVHTFGNGVEIEARLFVKAQALSLTPGEMKVVKVHFLPKIASGEQVSHPDQVPVSEKSTIRKSAMEGFIELAEDLRDKKIAISGVFRDENFMLLVDTNIGLALFLKQRCGFQGEWRTGRVWSKVSDFASEQNITAMKAYRASLP